MTTYTPNQYQSLNLDNLSCPQIIALLTSADLSNAILNDNDSFAVGILSSLSRSSLLNIVSSNDNFKDIIIVNSDNLASPYKNRDFNYGSLDRNHPLYDNIGRVLKPIDLSTLTKTFIQRLCFASKTDQYYFPNGHTKADLINRFRLYDIKFYAVSKKLAIDREHSPDISYMKIPVITVRPTAQYIHPRPIHRLTINTPPPNLPPSPRHLNLSPIPLDYVNFPHPSISDMPIIKVDDNILPHHIALRLLSKDDNCIICLDDLSEDTILVTKCGHFYCKECLAKTISLDNPKCGECRTEFK